MEKKVKELFKRSEQLPMDPPTEIPVKRTPVEKSTQYPAKKLKQKGKDEETEEKPSRSSGSAGVRDDEDYEEVEIEPEYTEEEKPLDDWRRRSELSGKSTTTRRGDKMSEEISRGICSRLVHPGVIQKFMACINML